MSDEADSPASGALGDPGSELSAIRGPGPAPDGLGVHLSARRITDLSTQIDFLEREVERYRETIEQDRIRHATELAELRLGADTALDDLRRREREQSKAIHDSYRAVLTERQLEHDAALSRAAAAHEATLERERARHARQLEAERARRVAAVDAAKTRTADELERTHERSRAKLTHDLTQATSTIARLKDELDTYAARAISAETDTHRHRTRATALQRRLDSLERNYQQRITESEAELAKALERIETERARSAATLGEVLEQSASIAAQADRARSENAASIASTQEAAVLAERQAAARYQALARAADDRAQQALAREAELEAVIAELRRAHGPTS